MPYSQNSQNFIQQSFHREKYEEEKHKQQTTQADISGILKVKKRLLQCAVCKAFCIHYLLKPLRIEDANDAYSPTQTYLRFTLLNIKMGATAHSTVQDTVHDTSLVL
ncbi:hypothetical protein ILYODFUR_028512 [Ilyodon furcidens]|uniref:Uncharacterized protein n=1 Tax=Ilyodon furcidens TaxID=33524 RepID=A0ABV0TNM2_9TELE